MQADLAPEQSEFLISAIASGQYRDENEAINEAVRLLQRRDTLKSKLLEAERELDAGLGIPADELFERLARRAAELDRGAGASQR